MISYEDALNTVMAMPRIKDVETVSARHAAYRVLAAPLLARTPIPEWNQSAMDGYALRHSDLSGVGPWRFRIVGESRTGFAPPEQEPNTVCRIFTGAALPMETDTVIMQENVEVRDNAVLLNNAPRVGDHVRLAGEDLQRGQLALPVGTRLNPFQLGLVSALDLSTVSVVRKPRVAILCTGDELRAPGSAPRPNTIPEANSIPITALTEIEGGIASVLPPIGDDLSATRQNLLRAVESADFIVTIGGISVGDHDHVQNALSALSARLLFKGVRIKPGKPVALNLLGSIPVLSLPGNPVSAELTYHLFGRPLLRVLQGNASPQHRTWTYPLATNYEHKLGIRTFCRAVLTPDGAAPLPRQSSAALTSTAHANALMILMEDRSHYFEGDPVDIMLLDPIC